MTAPSYPIKTDRLTLRPFVDDDLDDMHAFESHPDVCRFLYWEPRTPEESREELNRRAAQTDMSADGDHLILATQLTEPGGRGTVIGYVMLHLLSTENRQGEFGFVFHPDHHGRGYASEAARRMLDLAFDHYGLHRVIGRCDPRNTASAGLMERLGMRKEAHFVQGEIFKGEWGDEAVYAVLAREWAALRERGGRAGAVSR